MTDEALATATAEAAAIAPLPAILDEELDAARRHCRYGAPQPRTFSETMEEKAAYRAVCQCRQPDPASLS